MRDGAPRNLLGAFSASAAVGSRPAVAQGRQLRRIPPSLLAVAEGVGAFEGAGEAVGQRVKERQVWGGGEAGTDRAGKAVGGAVEARAPACVEGVGAVFGKTGGQALKPHRLPREMVRASLGEA